MINIPNPNVKFAVLNFPHLSQQLLENVQKSISPSSSRSNDIEFSKTYVTLNLFFALTAYDVASTN